MNELIQMPAEFWRRATWREIAPLPRPSQQPFDWDDLMQRLSNVQGKAKYRWYWNWAKAEMSIGMSRREAHFWLTMLLEWRVHDEKQAFNYAPDQFDGELNLSYVYDRMNNIANINELIVPLVVLFQMEDLLHLLLDGFNIHNLSDGFRDYISPYLTSTELEAFHPLLRQRINMLTTPIGNWGRIAAPYMWAAYTGMYAEIYDVINSFADDHFGKRHPFKSSQQPRVQLHELVFSIGDPALVVYHTKRLSLRLHSPSLIYTWLAHTETSELEYIKKSILVEKTLGKARRLIDAFSTVKTPETAAHMLEIMHTSASGGHARYWLEKHPELTITGLIPLASKRGNMGKQAQEHLRLMMRSGYEARILEEADEKLISKLVDNTLIMDLPEFDDLTTPVWLQKATADVLRKEGRKALTWVSAEELPSVIVGQHILNADQARALLLLLKSHGLPQETPDPFVQFLRKEANRHQLDIYLWQLFERWVMDGLKAKQFWAARAIALLGTDALVIRLRSLIREWASERKPGKWIEHAMEVIAEHGSDTAVLQLYQLKSDLHRFRKDHLAETRLNNIAIARGLSMAELGDIAVPDCDLNENGNYIFDYGPRQFTMVMRGDVTPMIRDEKGKIHKSLPRPSARDESILSEPAYERWKLMKKQIKDVVKAQSQRMETALRHERRWRWDRFATYFLAHPVMRYFAQHMIWGMYDQGGNLTQTFRIASDMTFADLRDEEITIDQRLQVGIAHPYHIPVEQRRQWGDIMHDYEIITPFPQLDREIFTLDDAQLNDKFMHGPQNLQIHLLAVRSTMHKLGWRDLFQYNTTQYKHYFPQQDISAIISFTWISNQNARFETAQRVDKCFFMKGNISQRIHFDITHQDVVAFKDISPVILSEVLRDLSIVR